MLHSVGHMSNEKGTKVHLMRCTLHPQSLDQEQKSGSASLDCDFFLQVVRVRGRERMRGRERVRG